MERMLMEYIVNSLWQAPLLAAGAWLVLRAGRPAPRVQHGVWLAALGLMVTMPLLSLRQAALTISPSIAASGKLLLPDASQSGSASLQGGAPVQQAALALPQEWDTPAIAATPTPPPAAAAGDRAAGNWLRRRELHLGPAATRWLVALYLLAAAFAMLRLLWSWRVARSMVAEARPAELSPAESALLETCCERFAVSPPRVLISARTSSPMVVGVLRPVLLLPEGFAEQAGEPCGRELEAVWWHELAHVRRRDYLGNVLCRLGALPVAYHPAVHAVGRRIRQTREMVCDEMAAEQMQSPVGYARCLVGLAQRIEAGRAMGMQAMHGTGMFDGGVLEERVKQLIESRTMLTGRVRVLRLAAGGTAMVAALAAVAVFQVTPTLAQSTPPQSPSAQSTPVQTAPAATVPTASEPASTASPVRTGASNGGQQVSLPLQPGTEPPATFVPRMAVDGKLKVVLPVVDAPFRVDREFIPLRLNGNLQQQLAQAVPLQATQAPSAPPASTSLSVPDLAAGQGLANADKALASLNAALAMLNSKEDREKFAADEVRLEQNARQLASSLALLQRQISGEMASPEMKRQLEQLNSPEFKKETDKIQAQLNSPEFKKRTAEVQAQVQAWRELAASGKLYYGLQGAALSGPQVPDKELYDRAQEAMKKGEYEAARLRLQTLINTYPDSRYRADAQMQIAESWDAEANRAQLEADKEYGAANPQAPKRVGGGISAPILIRSVEPDYTPEARAAKVSGTVLVNLWVDEQGRPAHVRVLRGLGNGLDAKAIEAVMQYRFKPAMENGQPALVELNVEVNFQIF